MRLKQKAGGLFVDITFVRPFDKMECVRNANAVGGGTFYYITEQRFTGFLNETGQHIAGTATLTLTQRRMQPGRLNNIWRLGIAAGFVTDVREGVQIQAGAQQTLNNCIGLDGELVPRRIGPGLYRIEVPAGQALTGTGPVNPWLSTISLNYGATSIVWAANEGKIRMQGYFGQNLVVPLNL